MTKYELAMELLKDKEKLDEKVWVRDSKGKPVDDFFIQKFNDIDGLLISRH